MRPVCLITGASAGIGAALARIFAQRGHALVLTARREAQLERLAAEIMTAGHERPHVITADLGLPGGPAHLAEALRAEGLEPSIVVNNAGFGLLGAVGSLDRAKQLAMIDLNVRALTDLSLAFVDGLERRRGGILNVASVASFLPGPGMAVYYASKAYVLSFSEALHRELTPRGVRVTALCPGPVPTEFQARAGAPVEKSPHLLTRSAAEVAQAGYRGLKSGRRLVVPGLANKVVVTLLRHLPRGLVLVMTDREMRRRFR
jgi:short-subunit dehydrogenase